MEESALSPTKLTGDLTPDALNEPVRPKFYSIAGLTITTFMGSVFAGAFLLASNYRKMGNVDAARTSIILGAVGLLVVAFAAYFWPTEPAALDRAGNYVIQGAQVAIVWIFSSRYQGSQLDTHEKAGGEFYSRWRAAGVGLLLLPVVLVFMVGVILALEYYLGVGELPT